SYRSSVVTASVALFGERLPAASRAATVNVYVVLALSAETLAPRPAVGSTSVELLYSAYSVTATLAAAASQARLTGRSVRPVTRMLRGVVGAWVSRLVTRRL